MSPAVIDLKSADDQRDVVHQVVQALAEGKVVALPTETVYGLAASALHADAVQRLLDVKGRGEGHPLALAIKSAEEALDYVPEPTKLGQRLARRCWPGPVTLVFEDNHPDSVLRQLPPLVQAAVSPQKTIGLRVPAHPFIQAVLRLVAGPLALSSANRTGRPDALTAGDVLDSMNGDVPLIIDDGQSRHAQPSSVVRVDAGGLKVLRAGVYSADALRRLAGPMALFVCTGNTCRSPMAEALLRKKLADKLGCSIDALEERGVISASAGVAAMAGGRAAQEAVDAMADLGLDISNHESQPLSDRLVHYADLILTMTRGHRDAILAQWPHAQGRVHVLCKSGSDVSDPIGGTPEQYRACAEQIEAALAEWLDELDLPNDLESRGTPA